MHHPIMRRRKSYRKLIMFAVIFLAAILVKQYSAIYKGVDEENPQNITVPIRTGENLEEISDKLEEKGLIANSSSFYWYARWHDMDTKILSGAFNLNTGMSVPEILTQLTDVSQGQVILTIPEGWTVAEIDGKMTELGLINGGEFLTATKNFKDWEQYPFMDAAVLQKLPVPLEGYIFPDTYFINAADFTPEAFIHTTLDNFSKKWLSGLNRKLVSQTMEKDYSNNEIVTMASIIEREVLGTKDKEIVAGIFWKRLENDWTLGADATLLYGKNNREITSADLETDSPYNTRKNAGLPPGPISNPGLESINAALYPVDTDYWFYLTTPDTGEVIYAKTNEEHNANREKYL